MTTEKERAVLLEQVRDLIPAEVRMISGCQDSQTSADVSNVASFSLPDPAGRAGGACTSALLKILYADHEATRDIKSFQQVLMEMRTLLNGGGGTAKYTQIPQLTSSRPLDVNHPFELVPADCPGTKRALLIGINYVGHKQGQLSGCHNDVLNMKEYIIKVWNFEEENITVLLDDGEHTEPTKENILAAYEKLVSESQEGDAAFCHYSGHGGKLKDDDNDEKDGYDETLVPVDYMTCGQIRDDDLFRTLISPMASGVTLTCIMDCCHSGTVLDLPFQFKADGESDQMQVSSTFDVQGLLGLAAAALVGGDLSLSKVMALVGQFVQGKSEQDLVAVCSTILKYGSQLLGMNQGRATSDAQITSISTMVVKFLKTFLGSTFFKKEAAKED
eukprot:CAMPEP_0119019954 /NCGR_PEP_ID=MMETSP1176-20130426/23029_1 /TAXON_ID=265551 /ORGANISM="Synedropsis recta cf, Strain CCMP1620" /LENGTH=387 /DNA_ID=CAMNT_0006974291 /DNA_START=117 /DNA_END=1280 /DNA_ORIENTATION=+